MKQLREQIKKEIKNLMEKEMRSFPVPPKIRKALEENLRLFPLKRYVATLKSVNSVPPSYRVFFHNNQFIDLYIEQVTPKFTAIKAIISNKPFNITDPREANLAMALLNNTILTGPIPVSSGEETSTDTDDSSSDDAVTEPDEEETEA